MFNIEYPTEGISFLVSFGRVMQYPSTCLNISYGANVFLGYLERGIACSLSIFGHEQHPFNNLDQNNSTMVFIV